MIFSKFDTKSSLPIASILLILIASGRPGDDLPDLNSLTPEELKGVTVAFERTQCYGTCPAYKLTIHGDGQVEYAGKAHVKENGPKQAQVEVATIKSLVSEFAKANFMSIAEEFSDGKCNCRVCTDFPTAITELTVKSVHHRVEHYYGCTCAPKVLFQLESAIDHLVQAERWTGDVSKAGPFGTTCFNR